MRCSRSRIGCSSSTSGKPLAEGEPHAVMNDPEVQARLPGTGGVSLLAISTARSAFYGDFQALFGVDFELHSGRAGRAHRRERRGQVDLPEDARGPARARRPSRSVFKGEADRRPAAAARSSSTGIALVPEGRRLFPSLSVEENLLMGGLSRAARAAGTCERVYELFPHPARSAAQPGDRALGRPAADGRARPRADEQPASSCCATSCRSGLAPVVIARDLRGAARRSAPKA